jgi:hypothetical protein
MARLLVSSPRNFCSSDNQGRVNFTTDNTGGLYPSEWLGKRAAGWLREVLRVRQVAGFLARDNPQRPDEPPSGACPASDVVELSEKLAFILLSLPSMKIFTAALCVFDVMIVAYDLQQIAAWASLWT